MPPLADLMVTPTAKPKRVAWQTMYEAATSWAAAKGDILTEGNAE